MEIVVTAFATLVAAGCFVAILRSDLADSAKGRQEPEPEPDHPAE